MLDSGGGWRSDWVQNLAIHATVDTEIGAARSSAIATIRADVAQHPARERLAQRYQGWHPGHPLSDWASTSLLAEFQITDDYR